MPKRKPKLRKVKKRNREFVKPTVLWRLARCIDQQLMTNKGKNIQDEYISAIVRLMDKETTIIGTIQAFDVNIDGDLEIFVERRDRENS